MVVGGGGVVTLSKSNRLIVDGHMQSISKLISMGKLHQNSKAGLFFPPKGKILTVYKKENNDYKM